MRKRLALVLIFAALASVAWAPAATAADPDDAGDYADWIRTLQAPNGAIFLHEAGVRVEPYVSNWAAWGLAREGGDANLDVAWNWLEWFRGHQYPNGAVHEHELVNGQWIDTGTYDSMDGSSGIYLLALQEAHLASGGASPLADYRNSIVTAVNSLIAIQQPDGLLHAKPGWPVKLLMGQAEAYGGLRAAATLADALGDATLAAQATASADAIRAGIDRWWVPAQKAYVWAEHEDGFQRSPNWASLYPDSAAQAWAVRFGLVDGGRARSLMRSVERNHPEWLDPQADSTYFDGQLYTTTAGYWPVIGETLTIAGRDSQARRGFSSIDSVARDTGFAWPFHSGNAGQMLLFADTVR